MEKDIQISTTSTSIMSDQLAQMRVIFPQFVKDGEIDFDSFREFFGQEGALAGQERYGLNWKGKSDAFRALRTPSTGTLTPQEELSKNWDDTENLFIEGDNLEVLKLLQRNYHEKIKMIYIDPPYNTGHDFVYKDNFTAGKSDYYEQTGQSEGGVKMTTNLDTNGRFHSDWLTMMYPRLFLARQLLREDGVVFVSIDDNEVANLRLIMDEIFGEENFVATIIWEKKYSPQNDATYFSVMHDYVLCFAKKTKETKDSKVGFNMKLLLRTEEQNALYKNPDNDQRGPWMSDNATVKTYSKNSDFEINSPSGNKFVPPPSRSWSFSRDRYKELLAEGRLWFGLDGKNSPRLKRFLSEVQQGLVPTTIWFRTEAGDNQEAAKEIRDIFVSPPFDTPKPTRLIRKMINLGTSALEGDLILDFFAGSATTAHATITQNAEDGGNRKFICIQIPEVTDEQSEARKAGFMTIADVSRERIRRAGEKIGKGDIGFKSYVLKSSNYRQWQNVTEDNPELLKRNMKLFIDHPLVDGYEEKNVVHEVLLKQGFDLNSSVSQDEVSEKKIWRVTDGDKIIVITFASKVEQDFPELCGLKKADNHTFVCFDNALDDSTKWNIARNVNLKTI